MSFAPVGCSMPAIAEGVGTGVGPLPGPDEGPGLPPAAGEQAALRIRTRLAASTGRAGRGLPEAGGWSVMARQTMTCTERFPAGPGVLWRCRRATPRSTTLEAAVATLDGDRILARRFREARLEEDGSL